MQQMLVVVKKREHRHLVPADYDRRVRSGGRVAVAAAGSWNDNTGEGQT